MLRRALSLCAVLGFASAAHAGAIISLTPSLPANGVAYQPGEVVNVDVYAQLTAGTPSVPGPSGTTNTIRVRLMQFDLADSDPALLITPVGHHPTQETQPFAGAIPFWDFSGSTICAGDELSCGTNYFVDGSLSATDHILNTTYTGTTSSGSFMITLNQLALKQVGEFDVTMPGEGGAFTLDVLNADETDINLGAELRWGFGSASDPTDPSSPLRANGSTAGGGLVMAPGQEAGIVFNVVPEPATLALLSIGGLATAFRRRRSA